MRLLSLFTRSLRILAVLAGAFSAPLVGANPITLDCQPFSAGPAAITCPGLNAGEVDGSTAAPCRDYIDPLTQVIYTYDCATGALTPDFSPAARADVYNRICAEPRGSTFCDGTGPASTACTWDWCVYYLAADAGLHDISVDLTAHTPICGTPETSYDVGRGVVAVTYAEGSVFGNGPCSGNSVLDATLLVDGVVVSEALTNY